MSAILYRRGQIQRSGLRRQLLSTTAMTRPSVPRSAGLSPLERTVVTFHLRTMFRRLALQQQAERLGGEDGA